MSKERIEKLRSARALVSTAIESMDAAIEPLDAHAKFSIRVTAKEAKSSLDTLLLLIERELREGDQ